MKNRYNPNLFLVGFLMNLLGKLPLLLIAGVFALIAIRNQTCRYAALGILIVSVVWSLIQQLRIKYTVEHSDNPNFEPFAKSMMSDNWKEAIKNTVEDGIRETEGNDPEE